MAEGTSTTIEAIRPAPQERAMPKPRLVDLRTESENLLLPPKIRIPAELLGADTWPELLRLTREQPAEYGIVVSERSGGLLTSKIFKGPDLEEDPITKKTIHPTISLPLVPHGPLSLLRPPKMLSFLHTHPVTKELNHLPTTVFSDADLNSFLHGKMKAFVMLDHGGVHILRGKQLELNISEINIGEIFDTAQTESEKGSKLVSEQMHVLGQELKDYGIQYYFSPETSPSDDGTVTFSDVSVEIPKYKTFEELGVTPE